MLNSKNKNLGNKYMSGGSTEVWDRNCKVNRK